MEEEQVSQDAERSLVTLQIDDFKVTIDFEKIASGTLTDVDYLRWADICSRAERECMLLDAHYRRQKGVAACALLAQDPKTPEWKTRAVIDESIEFQKLRASIAEVERNRLLLRSLLTLLQARLTVPAL